MPFLLEWVSFKACAMLKILDILFPRFCLGCSREGSYICKDCQIFLSEAETADQSVFSLWENQGLIDQIFREIKFKGRYHIIEELVERVFEKTTINPPPGTIITYVPMFKRKEKERGFNQAELIARKLGRLLCLERSVMGLLERVRDTLPQRGLGLQASQENIRSAFKYCNSFVPENVLLIDDICATGATIQECSKVLKKKGVKNVWAFTISRKTDI